LSTNISEASGPWPGGAGLQHGQEPVLNEERTGVLTVFSAFARINGPIKPQDRENNVGGDGPKAWGSDENIDASLNRKDHLSPEQLLDRLVAETRRLLLKGERPAESRSEAPAKNITQVFRGLCGLAQCIGGYALQDLNVDVRAVATQSLQGYWHGHAALTARLTDRGNSRLYLIDPTFIQFSDDVVDGALSPVSRLGETKDGQELTNALLERGYVELTPRRAWLYTAAFCQGHPPFATEEEAYRFLEAPPDHPYHFRQEPDSNRFSRAKLGQEGLLIRDLTL
jgi:hypothetical protein